MPAEGVVRELAKGCEKDSNPLLHQYTRSMVNKLVVNSIGIDLRNK